MRHDDLTQFAGWFLGSNDSFCKHIMADHYINWRKAKRMRIPVDSTPHYRLPGAFSDFQDRLYDYRRWNKNYHEIVEEMSIALEPNRNKLESIDVSRFNEKQIISLLLILSEDDSLLYEAAASGLLDRSLCKLKDIDWMSYPPGTFDSWQYPLPKRTYLENDSQEQYDEHNLPEFIWCLVGNIVDEHPYGPDHEIVHGTKHFSPGTKVYITDALIDDRLVVVGKPRKRYGLIKIILDEDLVENFRVQKVFSPQVIKKMYMPNREGVRRHHGSNTEEDRRQAELRAEYLNMTDEDFKRKGIIQNFNELVLSSQLADDPNSRITLRIEQKRRADGCLGSACFGFFKIGNDPERSIGLIDWYGYWPERKPYEESRHTFHEKSELLTGLDEAKLRLWDETYEADKSMRSSQFQWRLTLESKAGIVQSSGENHYPDALPSLYRFLHAFGFPIGWDSDAKIPIALPRDQ